MCSKHLSGLLSTVSVTISLIPSCWLFMQYNSLKNVSSLLSIFFNHFLLSFHVPQEHNKSSYLVFVFTGSKIFTGSILVYSKILTINETTILLIWSFPEDRFLITFDIQRIHQFDLLMFAVEKHFFNLQVPEFILSLFFLFLFAYQTILFHSWLFLLINFQMQLIVANTCY